MSMRRHLARWTLVTTAAFLTVSALGSPPVHAQQKTLSMIVAGSPGSSYSLYGRTFARYVKRYLPGEPNIIVKNMHGAGGNIAAEFMHAQGVADGSMFFVLPAGSLIDPLFNPARFQYDPNKFEYVGTMDQDTRVCLTMGKSPVKTFADARTQQAIIAGTQAGSTTVDYPNFLNALAGTKFKLVQGYRGTDDVMLAMERGEADGMCTFLSTVASLRPRWLGSSEANVFVQVALNPHPSVVTYKIPSIFDFVPADVKPIIELIATQQVFGRPVVLPAGTPPEQVALWRAAFMATMKDEEFLQEAAKVNIDINPLDGESVAALVHKMYAAPPDMVDRMAKAMKPAS
jgi:tripartite-type tricarboxylate transporter receptor subunit TctC